MLEQLNPPRRIYGYLLIGLTLAVTYGLWIFALWQNDSFYESWKFYPAKVGSHGTLILMCWAFILSTRFRPVEKLFGGLDKVYQAHRFVGETAFFLILLHPVFLALANSDDPNSFLRYLWFSDDGVRNTGIVALWAFILLVVLSVYFKIAYHKWKRSHDLFGLLLILIVYHAVTSGGEIITYPILTVWHGIWVTLGLSAYVYIRLLYRFFGPQYNYVTESVEQKPDAIVDIKLKPAGRRMRHAPGQFLYISLDTDAVSEEPHPFSISSPPDSPILRLSIKCLGDWTRSMNKIKPGERARVFGPYGHFSDEFFDHPDLPAVLIGGGIGITPMLSILHSQDLTLRKGPVQVIYSVLEEAKAVYDTEIAEAVANLPQVQYRPHYSNEEGYINQAYLENLLDKDLSQYLWLICGPSPMMTGMRRLLENAKVPNRQILMEEFNIR
jgi:predicted ferric reductase